MIDKLTKTILCSFFPAKIIGCGSKIGRNIAVAFARMGLKVALVDFNTQQTDSVAKECEEKSPRNRVVSNGWLDNRSLNYVLMVTTICTNGVAKAAQLKHVTEGFFRL